MSEKIEIDITSDTVCPWCYIGKRRLERAIEQMQVGGCRMEGYNFQSSTIFTMKWGVSLADHVSFTHACVRA